MRRAFFFIVAVCLATSASASIPRAPAHEHASAFDQPLSETRVWASEVLAPFERQPVSELTRALHQAYADSSTTNASGLGRFLSVDPGKDWDPKQPQSWNMYTYVRNNPVNAADPDGRQVQEMSDAYQQAARALKPVANVLSMLAPASGAAVLATVGAKTLGLGAQTGAALGSGASSSNVAIAVSKDVGTASEFALTVAGVAGPLATAATTTSTATRAIASETNWWAPTAREMRVSRWMSAPEASAFRGSGNLQVGAGNRTFVTEVGAPRAGNWGPTRMDFNVPAGALEPGGKSGWYFIGGWNRVPVTGIVKAVP